jgi:hypothetical protein
MPLVNPRWRRADSAIADLTGRPEEDACLRQAMEQFDGQKMVPCALSKARKRRRRTLTLCCFAFHQMWSKIIGQHGPKGTVDTILADRTRWVEFDAKTALLCMLNSISS